jgi:outer membrane protein insertion porin family
VRIENLPLVPGKDLDAQIHAHLPLYHGKVPSEGGLLDDVRHILEQILAVQGITATVTTTPFGTPGTKDVQAMSFSVASPPVQVGAIQLEGVSPELQAKLKAVVEHAVGTPFETENSARNLEQAFQMFYVEEGYAAVKVRAERSGDLAISPGSVAVPYTVKIDEGKTYKLGTVHLSSNAVMTQAEIDKAVAGFTQGQMKVRGLTLRNIWSFISARYKSKGYLDCKLTPHPEFDDAAGTASYTVDIDPGPVYHLAFVKFENVSDDLRKLLMRNWQMLPGDPFDESYVANFLINAQTADPVLQRSLSGVKATFDVHADPQTHDVNVVVRLQRS